MKKDIHPEYQTVVFHDVSVDYKVLTRSTMTSSETIEWEDGNSYPLVRVDLSSASHAFYTGKDRQVAEKGGRIEQFRNRYGLDTPPEELAAAAEAAAIAAASEAAATETAGETSES